MNFQFGSVLCSTHYVSYITPKSHPVTALSEMAGHFSAITAAILIFFIDLTIRSASGATDATCPAITIPNATITYLPPSTTTTYRSGTIAFLNCPLGWIPSGIAASTCHNGVWNPQMAVCKSLFPDAGVKCSAIASVANGQVVYIQSSPFVQNAAGTIAILICNWGYTVSGTTAVKCTSSGAWESLGTCESLEKVAQITCPNIIVVNGTVAHDLLRPRKVGTTSLLICNFGFVPVGASLVTCMSNGRWSADIGKCQYAFSVLRPSSVQCPVLSVASGSVGYDLLRPRSEGTAAVLFCNIGFLPNGNTIAVCQHNGQWSATLGKCNSVLSSTDVCPPLTAATNGFIAYDIFRPRQIGTMAILICNAGFIVRGTISVTCKDDKTWSGPIGSCNSPTL